MQLVEPRPNRPIPIRLTPLIDVVFILLVFFMVTSRLSPVDTLELANHRAESPAKATTPLPTLVLAVSGELRWNNETRPIDQLVESLKQMEVEEVVLKTEARATLSHFTQALSHLEQAGITTHWERTAPEAL
ncbi:ExbD/TolR family protein [Marinobacter sp. F4216]|uniref:ExbD/TolR family protein n=1 Tax=Marinobacter sp. F4216 TaxID=2874281 RepID=UPI001CC1BE0D|nr:biopolymer transporter ExbD [Marinobacter sp. F4216]MBZ2169450.1 biopolymer transporter ExbD [Marinobacter sp. F4216]